MKTSIYSRCHAVTHLLLLGLVVTLFSGCTRTSNPASDQGSLSDPDIKPAVIFTLPGNNAVGPFEIYNPGNGTTRPSFVVQFNKLMSTYSFVSGSIKCTGFARPVTVMLHQSYYPIVIGGSSSRISEPGSISASAAKIRPLPPDKASSYSNVLEFDIRDSATQQQMRYAVGQIYRITIDTTLEDINGNHLQYPYSFEFTPEPHFRVITTAPQNGTSNVNPGHGTAMTIFFNSPPSRASLSKVLISPSIYGSWDYGYDSSMIYFTSPIRFLYDQSYTVKIPAGASDEYGHLLASDYTTTFRTLPFGIYSASPTDGATGVAPITGWTFRQPVRSTRRVFRHPFRSALPYQAPSNTTRVTPPYFLLSRPTICVQHETYGDDLHRTEINGRYPPGDRFYDKFHHLMFQAENSYPANGSVNVDASSFPRYTCISTEL